MTNSAQHRGWTLNVNSWLATAPLALAIAIALALAVTQSAQAQTFTVLHTFARDLDYIAEYAPGNCGKRLC